jgi:hypothetical protein
LEKKFDYTVWLWKRNRMYMYAVYYMRCIKN